MAREEGRPPAADCNRLWALSGGRCAFPGCDQVLVERGPKKWVTQGEIAHIHARSAGGARFDSRLTVAQRDSYENTLLLCRRHHRLIDTDAAAYPAEAIKAWKNTREGEHVGAGLARAAAAGLLSPAPYPERHVPRAELAASVLLRAKAGAIALSGVSGSGKTTLAREALDLAADVNYRFWLRGHDELTLLSDLAEVGAFFGLPVPAEVDPDAVQPVLAVLADRPDWFVVVDDVRDLRALRHAPRGAGYVLITTQQATLPSLSTVVMEPLLEAETRRVLVTSPQPAAADEASVHRLAVLCEGLPLAAAQIAAFSAATATPADVHLALLEQRRGELLARGQVLHHQTFHASIELALGGLTEDARALLDVLSALANAPVSLSVPVTSENPVGALQDRLRFEDAAADLRRFSLITRDVDTFRVHALVRDVVQVLSQRDRVATRFAAAALVGQQIPEWTDRADSWPIMQALEPHLLEVLGDRLLDQSGVSAFIANRLGPYLCSRGRAEQARQVLEGGLEALDSAREEDVGGRGSLLQNLANALVDIGDFEGGERAMRESLELKMSAYGPGARLTGVAHSGLGNLLLTLGKRDEARVEHERALAVYSELGDVVLLADALSDLAHVAEDEPGDADEYLRRAESLVADRPDAWTVHSHVLLGRSDVAEKRQDWSEAVRLAVAAAKVAAAHADASTQLAAAQAAHGRLLWHVGLPEYGLRMLRRSYDTYIATGDTSSPAAARAQGNLGYYGIRSGMLPDEALMHLRESLDTLRTVLPAQHPSVRTAERMLEQVRDMVGELTGDAPPFV